MHKKSKKFIYFCFQTPHKDSVHAHLDKIYDFLFLAVDCQNPLYFKTAAIIYYAASNCIDRGFHMLTILLTSIVLTAAPGEPTEIIGTAATPDGGRDEITVEQPQNAPNPFGYIAPSPNSQFRPPAANSVPSATPPAIPNISEPSSDTAEIPLVSQSSSVNPHNMNPLDYQNKIENTIYQEGDRLIDVQSIPLKDISSAVQPNLQPTITDYPSF